MSVSEHHAGNRNVSRPPSASRKGWSRRGAISLGCAGLLLLTGIGSMALSPASVLNALTLWGRYRASQNIAYAPGPRGRLDVYAPDRSRGRAPVVVFFYGGSWQSGDKGTYRFVGAALAASGFIVVIPDYRVYPEVRSPDFLEDAARAVRWAHDHAAEFGGDASRMVLVGHSAGGQIAAMLTFDRQWLASVGLDPSLDLKGLVGLAGPYDFLPLRDPTLDIIFGPDDRLAASQPINFVNGTAPPAFLVSGRDDHSVDPGNVTRLARRIGEKGGVVTTKFYDGIGHAALIGAFAAPLRPLAPVLRDTVSFIHKVTGEPVSAMAPDIAKAAQ